MSHEAAETAPAGMSWGGVRRTAFGIDMAIGRIAELIGAALVLVETCILFAGVVSRYVFNSPIIWTDELATFLFLWMATCSWRGRRGAARWAYAPGRPLSTGCSPQWGNWLSARSPSSPWSSSLSSSCWCRSLGYLKIQAITLS